MSTEADGSAEANKETVQALWSALYERDWDAIGRLFAADSEYTDVPSPADDVAHGPDQIVARLRLGLERISGYEHDAAPDGGRGRRRGDRAFGDLALAHR